jgi:hypothetical protein
MSEASITEIDQNMVLECFSDRRANQKAQERVFSICQDVNPATGGPEFFPFITINGDHGQRVGRNYDPTRQPILDKLCEAANFKPEACSKNGLKHDIIYDLPKDLFTEDGEKLHHLRHKRRRFISRRQQRRERAYLQH